MRVKQSMSMARPSQSRFPKLTDEMLDKSVQTFTRYLTPFSGHDYFPSDGLVRCRRRSSKSPRSVGRLIIRSKICESKISLCIVHALVAVFLLWRFLPPTSGWYLDPATLLGTLTFFRHHLDLANQLQQFRMQRRPVMAPNSPRWH